MQADNPSSSLFALALWSRHEVELRRWLLSRSPAKSDVDDQLHDAFLKNLQHGDRLAAITQPQAGLFEVELCVCREWPRPSTPA